MLLFIVIVIFPIKLKAKIHFNLLKNSGTLRLKLFRIVLLEGLLSFHNFCLEITNKKDGRITVVPISFGEENFFSQTDFEAILMKKIHLKQATLYVRFGSKTDALLTATVAGIVRIVSSCIGAVVKTKKGEARITTKTYPCFNKDELSVDFKGIITISIFDFVWALIIAVAKKILEKKEVQNG